MKNIKLIIFIIIILIAIGLRLTALDKYPAGLTADEASIGFNAHSLMQTGKDEYGKPWPLVFKSFGDYKPGLYFYMVMPTIALFGMNEWAIRIPSALFGIATVILIYFLAKEIFENKWVGLCSSLLLAVSSWHLQFSRGGWESNVATFFITLGIYLFLKSLKNKKLLWWSMVSFLVSMYTYQSPRLIIPVLLIILAVLYRKYFIHFYINIKDKNKFFAVLALIILTIPLIFQFISGGGSERFSGLSFLSDIGPKNRTNELRGEHENANSLEAKIIHNKVISYGVNFFGHYLDHFRSDFLFIRGDMVERNKVPETGQFYLFEAFLLGLGLVFLIIRKFEHTKLLIVWVLVAPIASSMTFQTPNALRSLNMVLPLIIIMGYGLWIIIKKLGQLHKFIKVTFITVIIIILAFEFIHYLESYYIHYPKRYPQAFEYGFKEMVQKLELLEPSYNNVVITDKYDQPYILVLFYKNYDPQKYQPQATLSTRDKFNFGTVRSFDKYEFRSIKPDEINTSSQTLFIATEKEIPQDAKIIDRVYFPNGQIAFVFAKKNEE